VHNADPNSVWAIAMCAAGMLGFAYGWLSKPPFRKGCNECGAVERRQEERQREVVHDMQHKGLGPGINKPDRYDCADITCPRNKTNRPS
jgi:hypothetical protein